MPDTGADEFDVIGSAAAEANRDYVLKTVQERHIHFIRMWFTDVLGQMKSFAITPSELETAFDEGMGFDGSSIEGFARAAESDMIAFPDASTFQVLPERKPFDGDPRYVLRCMLTKAARMGYTMNVGPELEYFYFKNSTEPDPIDYAGFFDLTADDTASDLRRDTILTLEQMGIPVEYSHHEAAPSQQEIDLRYSDALSMADAVMTYKLVVKEIAMKHGVYASFMPKPLSDAPGSGMHVHMSLFDFDGSNVFFDPDDPQGYHLSATAKSFLAGILKYAPEFALITNPCVNSYKRLLAGGEAPIYLSWARANRSTLVRVPGYRPNREMACRLELRSPDPSANPYLTFAVMLAAGLAGIEEGLEPPAPVEDRDLFTQSRQELLRQGFRTLPESLGQAVELFRRSKLMRETLGDHICDYLVEAKQAEWDEYQSNVSTWELDRYLAVL